MSGVNKEKRYSVFFLSLLFSMKVIGGESFSYQVYVAPPFSKVEINRTQTCHSICLLANQAAGSVILFTGIKNHRCYYWIDADGALTKEESSSYFCDGGFTIPPSNQRVGEIHLPKHF